jgi:sterol desaturase/sphingolipid hydroxylase (fatty acid hydroxylase superfamily)
MPTPLEVLLDPISLTAIGIYLALVALEAFVPARPLPEVRGWVARGLIAFVAFFYLSTYLPLAWDASLAPFQLLDLTSLGTVAGAAVGVLVYELAVYWWHRAMHRFTPLWRVFHQMHHSAERLDTYGAFWFSPMDMIGWTALGSFALVIVVGLTPTAATATILITFFLGVFQHTNVRTPQWLGFFVQRPESHSVHHERGLHYYNFSDLPVWDLIFGTFRNPKAFSPQQGFYEGASGRILEMIAFADVSQPPGKAADATLRGRNTQRGAL